MRVSLNGIVSSDDDLEVYEWFNMLAFSPASVRKAIRDNPEGEELVLEINSPGGSVFAGGEIYTVLKDAAQTIHIRAEIQSLAASAASYLCLGCSEVLISPVALMMVHMPTTATRGDRTAHQRSIGLLDSVREAILNAYERKAGSGASRAEFRRMMSNETWLTAQMARDLGLVDGILYEESAIPENVMNLAAAGVRNQCASLGGCGGMDLDAMRAEYRSARAAKGKPVEAASFVTADAVTPSPKREGFGADNWRAGARLELEKSRYTGSI